MDGKRFTDISNNSTNDNLSLVSSPDCGAELRVIPGIDFPLSADERSIWVHICDLFGDWPVRSSIGTGSYDNWQVEELSDSCVNNDVAFELIGRIVANQLEKPKLVVHHEEHGIVLVNPAESLIFHYGGC